MDEKEAIKSLGMGDKEASVYLALLQLGQASAYQVATKSGLKKPTTYVVLDALVKKGVVNLVPRSRKRLYRPRLPEQLLGVARERLVEFEDSLPRLKALTRGSATKFDTLYYQGGEGIKRSLLFGLDRLKFKEIVGFYAKADLVSKDLLPIYDEFNNKMKRRRIRVRGIVPDHPSLKHYRKLDKEYRRDMRMIAQDLYSSDQQIDIAPDFVRIIDHKNLQAVVIENEDLAKTFRQIFELVWAKY
ncbi:MAG: helix-turn-helix domain-containing protein [Patescibacteria group bacterium]